MITATAEALGACGFQRQQRELSVLIKAFNEEPNIDRTLRSVLQAIEQLDAEIILADSLSTDRTIEIASRYPITIVQLHEPRERSWGVGAQLAYQHSCGRLVLVMDGDMELSRDWLLAAMRRLGTTPGLAGVGGIVEDINLQNIEFRARQTRKNNSIDAGVVDRLYGGGLFRRDAIEQIGYLTHRGLHAFEELELALRLQMAGWKLERLDIVAIRHYGHTEGLWALIRRRWKTGYVNGAGELFRSSLGRPWFWLTLRRLYPQVIVLMWWASLLILGLAALLWPSLLAALIAVAATPFVLACVRKRSIGLGAYAILSWTVDAAGFVRGMTTRIADPREKIHSHVLTSRQAV